MSNKVSEKQAFFFTIINYVGIVIGVVSTLFIYPNDKADELRKLKEKYGAEPDNIGDVILLTPKDKMEERQAEYFG